MTDVLAERQQIDALIEGRNVAHAFADTVEAQGESPAFSDKIGVEGPGWRTLSWRELREQGLELAAALVELGVQPGDRVAIMASNRIEHVLADIGAMHAGATSMSIYNTLSPSQVAYVAEHSGAGRGGAGDRRPRPPLVRGARDRRDPARRRHRRRGQRPRGR